MESKVFGGPTAKMEGALKNPNQYRDAVLYESLNMLPGDKIREFVDSEEAKVMINKGFMSPEVVDRLHSEHDSKHGICPHVFKTTVCHLAKQNDDPEWAQLVELRTQERRLFNSLVEKYGDQAVEASKNAEKDIVEAFIPEYFRQ